MQKFSSFDAADRAAMADVRAILLGALAVKVFDIEHNEFFWAIRTDPETSEIYL